eukprot:RCo013361
MPQLLVGRHSDPPRDILRETLEDLEEVGAVFLGNGLRDAANTLGAGLADPPDVILRELQVNRKEVLHGILLPNHGTDLPQAAGHHSADGEGEVLSQHSHLLHRYVAAQLRAKALRQLVEELRGHHTVVLRTVVMRQRHQHVQQLWLDVLGLDQLHQLHQSVDRGGAHLDVLVHQQLKGVRQKGVDQLIVALLPALINEEDGKRVQLLHEHLPHRRLRVGNEIGGDGQQAGHAVVVAGGLRGVDELPDQNQPLQREVAGVVALQAGQRVQAVVNGVFPDEVFLLHALLVRAAELVVHHFRGGEGKEGANERARERDKGTEERVGGSSRKRRVEGKREQRHKGRRKNRKNDY